MQSDSSSSKLNVNNDATTSQNVHNVHNDVWASDIENLESLFTDKNRFNQSNENSKDKSPNNLFNDCTNKSTDNSNDKFKSRKSTRMEESNSDNSDQEDQDVEMNENEMNDDFEDRESSENNEQSNSDEESDLDKNDENKIEKKETKKRRKKTAFERRNIKKLIKEDDLDEKIKTVRKEEEERINRILEQQKQLKNEQQQQNLLIPTTSKASMLTEDIILSSDDEDVQVIGSSDEEEEIKIAYERIQDELDATNSGLHTDDSLNTLNNDGRCLVNIGHPSSDPDIFLDDYLAKKVKPHQIGGVRFMYDCIVDNLNTVKTSEGIGCILAHSMGLGKTLTTISFIELFLRVTDHKHILCIVPVNTIQNWVSEFDQWLPDKDELDKIKERYANRPTTSRQDDRQFEANDYLELRKPRKFNVYSLAESKTLTQRAFEIRKWRESVGVLLMGYETYRMFFDDKSTKLKSKKTSFEGLNKSEYLELLYEVKSSIIDPGPDLVICDEGHRIKNCKASISKALEEIRTKRRICLTGYPLQNSLIEYWCMVNWIRPEYLGTKSEFSNMFEKPIKNGQCVDSQDGDRILSRKRAHVLHKLLIGFVQRRSFTILLDTLPRKQEFCLYIRMTKLQKDLLLAFFRNLENLLSIRPFAKNPLYIYSVCHKIWNHTDVLARKMLEDDSDDDDEINHQSTPKKRLKSLNADYGEDEELNYDWANELMDNYKSGILENSMKMILLFGIIDETIKIGERILVFSQSIITLNVIEEFLCQREIPNKKGHKFERGVNYLRLDGSTSALDRKNYIDRFNNNTKYHLFLISTKAGCLGINLTGANRLIVLDISFNPCHDAQAVHRIYRYGQKKECFVYRFIFDNSLEKRIFDRQISKQSIFNQIVDEINSDASLTINEILSMVDGLDTIEDPPILEFSENELNSFTDPIMRIICRDYSHCLTKKPIPHESLLAESEETKLSRAEKQRAEYEYNLDIRKRNFIYNNNMKKQNLYNNDNTLNSNSNSNYMNNTYQTVQPNTCIQNPQLNPQFINSNPNPNPNPMFHGQSNTYQTSSSNIIYNNQMPQQSYNIHPSTSSSIPQYNQQNIFNSVIVPNNIHPSTSSITDNSSLTNSFNQFNAPQSSEALVPFNSSLANHELNSNLNNQTNYQSTNSFGYNPSTSSFNSTTNLNSNFNDYQSQTRIDRSNVSTRQFQIPSNLTIRDETGTEITLRKNQIVMLIQSSNSLILKTFSGKQVHIKGPFVNYFTALNQPNQNTNFQPNGSSANYPPEVVDLIDDD